MNPWRLSPVLRRSAVVLISALAVIASLAISLVPAEAHPRPPHPRTHGYVALGDSYASGEGLAPYVVGTEGPGQCHRSLDQSYPALLADSGRRDFDDLTSVACSGAVTADLVRTRSGSSLPPQLSGLDRHTTTVTLTVGGNDAGFGQVLGACVYSADPRVTVPGAAGCADRYDALVSARIAALGGGRHSLPEVYPLRRALLRAAAAAPRASISVTGYPLIFGTQIGSPYGCQVSSQAPLFVTASDAAWIRTKATDLNEAIKAAVRSARHAGADVRYVDVATAFRGHELCDQASPWLNGVVIASLNPTQLSTATFHPTADGQSAYADAVAARAGRHASLR